MPATLAYPVAHSLDAMPGPSGLPWLGSALRLRGDDIHEVLRKWSEEFGPVYKFKIGSRRIVAISDPDMIASLLRDRPSGFRRGPRLAMVGKELGLDGVFLAEGDEWKAQRPIVMRALDPTHLKGFFPLLVKATEKLYVKWQRAALGGDVIDLRDDLTRYTMDVTCSLAFGQDAAMQEDSDASLRAHLDRIFDALIHRPLSPVDWWRYFKTPADRRLDQSVEAVRCAVENFIELGQGELSRRPELRTEPENLLQALLAANEEARLPAAAVRGNVMTFLLAGEDTTASLMAWTLDLLVESPDCFRKVRSEALQACGAAPLISDFSKIRNLPYLDAVIQESLRLKPVVPLQAFQAIRDTTLGDYFFPKDTVVTILNRPAMMEGSAFAEPTLFKPERWLNAGGEPGDSDKSLVKPFGAGPRFCPGRYLARVEAASVLSMAARSFEFSRVGARPVEQMSLTMRPKGLFVKAEMIRSL